MLKTKSKNKLTLNGWLKNANASGALSALLRSGTKKERMYCSESAKFREVKAAAEANGVIKEGAMARVILISEGLGNRHDMNYYSPEAIQSAPSVFEGKPCFIDHPTETESKDIPERSVRKKCGYFKNCSVEVLDNLVSCTGELHFDLSEDGNYAYDKARTALHYKQEFPGFNSEYVGLSIAADGDREKRTINLEGETLDVNYVVRFTEAVSCDIVTSPARGGRFLALVESAAGAIKKNREADMKVKGIEKSLKAAHSAIEEANKETDLDAKAKKLAEAKKLFDSFLSEAMKTANEEESREDEAEDSESGESENEDEAKKKESGESEDENDSSGDSHTVTTHKVVKKTGKAAVAQDDDDAVESKRIAIATIAKESGIDLPAELMSEYTTLSLKEARAKISGLKKLVESMTKKVIKESVVPAANFAKLSESERKTRGAENNGLFSGLVR